MTGYSRGCQLLGYLGVTSFRQGQQHGTPTVKVKRLLLKDPSWQRLFQGGKKKKYSVDVKRHV